MTYNDIHYSMVIEWSDEDVAYIVSFPEWGDLAHTHGATYAEAVLKGEEVLDLLASSTIDEGEPLPHARRFTARYADERRAQSASIDAGFAGMDGDREYLAESAALEAGLDRSSWETLRAAEARHT
jgi:predicted RNase H-like HicB family nuclease